MTEEQLQPAHAAPDANVPLPALVYVSSAFSQRLPSQRVLDLLTKLEGVGFSELATTAPFRIVAFRALLIEYPNRDPASLWAHAYDVEVEVADAADPTGMNGKSTTPAPDSADSGR
jgi:hypothetical protein